MPLFLSEVFRFSGHMGLMPCYFLKGQSVMNIDFEILNVIFLTDFLSCLYCIPIDLVSFVFPLPWKLFKLDPQKTGPPWISANFLSPCRTILCKGSLTKLAIFLNWPCFLVPVLATVEKFHYVSCEIGAVNRVVVFSSPEPKAQVSFSDHILSVVRPSVRL
jgi:hypothetical protein